MRVGVPTEVKDHEYRVAITPAGVQELVAHGHEVVVEQGAGAGSSIPDQEYIAAGAKIIASADEVWALGDLLLKVKEPVAQEYHRLRRDQAAPAVAACSWAGCPGSTPRRSSYWARVSRA